MANAGGDQGAKNVKTVIESAFQGDQAPAELSVGIVSLIELCNLAMPNPAAVRQRLQEAEFAVSSQDTADMFAKMLALDNKVMSFPVRGLSHKAYTRDRQGETIQLLLSEGDSDQGKIVFVSTLFRGAIEADAVKAAAHVTKKQPITGAAMETSEGWRRRRVFWDTEGVSGVRGLMVTGPEDVESTDHYRAITAFNLVGKSH